uniref:Uncharacterized protein n=1 Tax=Rhizophagus irregularis (strain DAOM 181602 / DAOM 197198 / MUCL 43194) TaxID=747089 RepID=U9TB54_RHIID
MFLKNGLTSQYFRINKKKARSQATTAIQKDISMNVYNIELENNVNSIVFGIPSWNT